MCGLFGIYSMDQRDVDLEDSMRMLDLLSHRGPDGRGYHHDGRVFLGHTRLSIIDVEGGKQPIYNEDGSIVVVGNGEIYNHEELRRELAAKGHRFKTRSDTEVLIHLFEEEGEGFLGRLNGMFAFAIYDTRNGKLFLARDRIGIKPLYYYCDEKRFIFSSEMKAIIKSGLVPLEINDTVVYQFLTLHFSIPPETLIKGILSVRPGHYVSAGPETVREGMYWDIESNVDDSPLSYEDAFHDVESTLLDSVEKRLMSDVPLGLFLSGGIDSSLIAVLMHRLVGDGIKTFSIGFEEKEFSELPYSRQISEQISSDHMEIIVTPKEMMDNIESVIWYRETPISELADIPVFLLSRAAARKVKVVLTGEGGDEVFAGYNKYVYEEWAQRAWLLRNPVARALFGNPLASKLIPQRMSTAFDLFSEGDRYRRYYRWFSYFRDEELKYIVRDDRRDFVQERNFYKEFLGEKRFKTNLDEMQYLDVKVWLPDNLLLRGDRMSMASSLEARVPFLDHRLVEMSYRLPKTCRIRNSSGKYIIKKIAEKYLDKNIIYRKKVGFEVPVSKWFRSGLKDFMISHLTRSDSFCLEIFDRKHIEALVNDHVEDRSDNHKKLWILLNLELWRDQFLRNGR